MMFNFGFIKLEYFNLFRKIIEYLSIHQTNDSFIDIGVKDGSTIVNLMKLILMILLLIMLHLFITPLITKCRKQDEDSKCKIIGDKLFSIFVFAIYIRIVLQSISLILLSIISEVNYFRKNKITHLASLLFSIIIFGGILSFF